MKETTVTKNMESGEFNRITINGAKVEVTTWTMLKNKKIKQKTELYQLTKMVAVQKHFLIECMNGTEKTIFSMQTCKEICTTPISTETEIIGINGEIFIKVNSQSIYDEAGKRVSLEKEKNIFLDSNV